MSNETNNNVTEEPIKKTSKLKKIRNAVLVTGVYTIPIGLTGVSFYYSIKTQKMNYETAKLQLEVAKEAANAIQ